MTDENQVTDDDWAAAMGEQSASETTAPEPDTAPHATPKVFEDFSNIPTKTEQVGDYDMILDIPVTLSVELGRTRIAIKDLLQLAHGSVVELEGMAGEPMDVLVNGTLIAQGEVVVVNERFGIRLTDIITPAERINKLRR